jgi:1,4-alpha-glucan branching enzyme
MSSSKLAVLPYTHLTDLDIFLFKQGRHFHLFDKLGSHLVTHENIEGTYFALWAPNAKEVSVIGDFNRWNKRAHPLFPRWDQSGIWEGFIAGVVQGSLYKYALTSSEGLSLEKGDPFAMYFETPPNTASIVWGLNYPWEDEPWTILRLKKNQLSSPISIYEMHIGSWRHKTPHASLNYLELSQVLPSYLRDMGFTHVEFMPAMEHPFYGSWGYQKTGYFAPSSRFGTPQDFMHLINALHQAHIGVFLDWVPSHFPSDAHSLAKFDGTCLFEHEDPRQGFHPDWKSYIFNYTRPEVCSFLISSAVFWLKKYHIDGLRVDAVSSMLYLDYSRKPGEWVPNIHGGHENLAAIAFLQTLNEYVYEHFPNIQMIAEESTSWPQVSRPTSQGGLGFGLKWNMGWMHDTLRYFSKDPLYRKHDHHLLLFSMCYFFSENFILSISHDEVVYGEHSLLNKMPGDQWQKFANLRLLYSYMFAHPGKKLLFMGSEIAPWKEWNHDGILQWDLLERPAHLGIQNLLRTLNQIYQEHPALYELDFHQEGFEWVSLHDSDSSVIAFLRHDACRKKTILALYNFTPIPRENYTLQLPSSGIWKEIFNSDLGLYGGSNRYHHTTLKTTFNPHNSSHELYVQLPPLGALFFKKESSL